MATKKKTVEKEVSVEDKLKSLYKLQSYLSEIDRIKTCGESFRWRCLTSTMRSRSGYACE